MFSKENPFFFPFLKANGVTPRQAAAMATANLSREERKKAAAEALAKHREETAAASETAEEPGKRWAGRFFWVMFSFVWVCFESCVFLDFLGCSWY